jgi:hypothetical protein
MKPGEALHPPWSEVSKKWMAFCAHRPPRTFLQIFDVSLGRSVQANGFSLLGYRDDREFSTGELLELTHENQRRLLAFQTECVYRVFIEKPELIKEKGVTYCNIRSFRDAQGQYWRVHQASTPFQYDQKGRLVRYLSHYRIIGRYNGEPFETGIYTDPRFPGEQRLLMEELKKIKNDLLRGLGFSPREEKVIRLMAKGIDKEGIARDLGITARTVDKHRSNILDKGRIYFPLNNFSQSSDVVRFLDRQWLL